jgi:ATP-dependent RNA helicase DDX1
MEDFLSSNADQSRFERLHVCFFSATLHSPEVRDLAEQICYQPLWIDLRGAEDSMLPDTVHHCFVPIDPTSFQPTMEFSTTDAVHRHGKLNEAVSLEGLEEKEVNSQKSKQLKLRAVKDIIDKFSMDRESQRLSKTNILFDLPGKLSLLKHCCFNR